VFAPFPYAYRYGWPEADTVAFCLRELDQLLLTTTAPTETAAIVVEPVLGEGGYVPVPDAFMVGLRERCDRHGILLIADEVQTGVGRTGRMWGMEHSGVRPDVVVTAKGLASGMPLSAIVATPDLMSAGFPGSQGGTYGGNPVACAAAIATLQVVEEEGLVANSAARGEQLIAGVGELATRHEAIGDVRGRGLMIGLELIDHGGRTAGELVQATRMAAAEAGLLTLPCGATGQVLRLIPALVVNAEQIDTGLSMLDDALAKACAG
jgi:4-aminobutyrate aminotransferase